MTKVADEYWIDINKNKKYYVDFYLLSYEHLLIFRKPEKGEDLERYRESMRWW
ncbi:MAG: hypothetical protein QXL29_08235 [Zestosphaera sp.]